MRSTRRGAPRTKERKVKSLTENGRKLCNDGLVKAKTRHRPDGNTTPASIKKVREINSLDVSSLRRIVLTYVLLEQNAQQVIDGNGLMKDVVILKKKNLALKGGIPKLIAENSVLLKEKQQLQGENQQLLSQNSALQVGNLNLKEEIKRLVGENSDLTSINTNLKEKNESLNELIRWLKERNEEQSRTQHDLVCNNSDLRSENSDLRSDKGVLERTLLFETKRREEDKDRFDKGQCLLSAMKFEVQSLEKENDLFSEIVNQLNEELTLKNNEIVELNMLKDQKARQVRLLREQMNEESQLVLHLRANILQKESDIIELQARLATSEALRQKKPERRKRLFR